MSGQPLYLPNGMVAVVEDGGVLFIAVAPLFSGPVVVAALGTAHHAVLITSAPP
jgi:hypothetical protein